MSIQSMRTSIGRRLALRHLPIKVARFRSQAERAALKMPDPRAIKEATPPHQVKTILELARGRTTLVEVGTSAGWTTMALAIDNPGATITTYDPEVLGQRETYKALARSAAAQITFVPSVGETPLEGPESGVDFLFIDANHRRQSTYDTFELWKNRLTDEAIVVFHDYTDDWPGVVEAIADLGLAGQERNGMYVWHPRDGYVAAASA